MIGSEVRSSILSELELLLIVVCRSTSFARLESAGLHRQILGERAFDHDLNNQTQPY